VETEIEGTEDILMDGIAGVSLSWTIGGSAILMVGIAGAETVDPGSWGFEQSIDGAFFTPSRLEDWFRGEAPRFVSASLGFQSISKLTIGLPF